MRAYSHQGHGPRADQTGRIHISDFRFLRTISLAKRSRSIHSGQSRHFDGALLTSDIPRLADMLSVVRHVANVPFPDLSATRREVWGRNSPGGSVSCMNSVVEIDAGKDGKHVSLQERDQKFERGHRNRQPER
jgi:hypothetical protein